MQSVAILAQTCLAQAILAQAFVRCFTPYCAQVRGVVARLECDMSDSDGDILLVPAAQAEPTSDLDDDDGDIMLMPDALEPDAGDEQAQQPGGPSESLMSRRPFAAWIVGVDSESSGPQVVGAAELEWRVREASPDVIAAHAAITPGGSTSRGQKPWGYLQYTLLRPCLLTDAVDLDPNMDLHGDALVAHSVTRLCAAAPFRDGGGDLSDILDTLDSRGLSMLVVPMVVARALTSESVSELVASIPLGLRFRSLPIPFGFPRLPVLVRARREILGQGRRGAAAAYGPETKADYDARYRAVILKLPSAAAAKVPARTAPTKSTGTAWDIDPLKCLNALDVCQYLKSNRFFGKVMAATHRYDHAGEARVPAEDDPSRTSLDRAESRLDLVDMLLLRRRWEADMAFDRVESIHVYSDSSPVTGEELQGMVMDIFYHDDSFLRVVLPGCTLSYGNFNAVSKAMALVWAAWLVTGPSEAGLQYFLTRSLPLSPIMAQSCR